MTTPLRILLVEDSENDTILLMRHLRQAGYEPTYHRVQTAPAMEAALADASWDIIISDYRMPQFSGLEALKVFQKYDTEIPFLIVSGTIGEALAVEAMKAGAHDYLMKNNLTRLVPAIQRELKDAEIRRERKKAAQTLRESEQRYRTLFESSPMSIIILGLDGHILDCNSAIEDMFGLQRDDIVGRQLDDLGLQLANVPKEVNDNLLDYVKQAMSKQTVAMFEATVQHQQGGTRWLDVHLAYLKRDGETRSIQIIARDITDRKSAEKALVNIAERLTILHEVDKAILSARSAEMITQAALHHVRKLIPYDIAGIVMIGETGTIDLLAAFHGDSHLTENQFPFKLIYELPQIMDVLRQGAPFVMQNPADQPQLADRLKELELADVNTLLNIPLLFQGDLIGFMSFAAKDDTAFGSEQIDIAYELALQLAIAIQQARLHEAISYHATELEVRVDERTAELQAANERLVALSRAKDEFVSNVSHELRTPLSSLFMRQALLARTPHQLDKHLKVMDRETMRLKYMLEDLLRLSRLDQGRVNLEMNRIDFNQMISQYVIDRKILAEENSLDLRCICSEKQLFAIADFGLLEQVVGILLTNAINYTPAGGLIIVKTFEHKKDGKDWVCFSINDTGPGISKAEMGQLFERFFRGSSGRNSHVPGTGLGLAIAKEIIDRHEGHIEVESDGLEGKGTTFTVCLPAPES